MLTFYHICFVISLHIYILYFSEPFESQLRAWCLFIPKFFYAYFSQNKYIILFNLSTVNKFKKSTLMQYNYLIYKLYSPSPVVLILSFIAKRKKNSFLILNSHCKLQIIFSPSLSFVFWLCLLWFYAVQNYFLFLCIHSCV